MKVIILEKYGGCQELLRYSSSDTKEEVKPFYSVYLATKQAHS